MKIDKYTHLLFLFVIVVIIIFTTIIGYVLTTKSLIEDIFGILKDMSNGNGIFFLFGIGLLIVIISFFISKLNYNWINYFVYKFLTVIILLSIGHYFFCGGGFCELIDVRLVTSILIFIITYSISNYFKD
ncbi:MAG: hypothetical protein WC850_01110 [Candidatus Gracilibacteria bacterium]